MISNFPQVLFFWEGTGNQNDCHISLVNYRTLLDTNCHKTIATISILYMCIYNIAPFYDTPPNIHYIIRKTYNSRWFRSGRCHRCIAKTRGNAFARTRTAASTDRMGNGIKCTESHRNLNASKITAWLRCCCLLMPYFWLWWQSNYRSPICWCRWRWVLICTFMVADGCSVPIILFMYTMINV